VSDMGPTAAHVRSRPITAAEYYRMGEVGILGPDERVELLNGRIITMPPIGPRHAQTVRSLTRIFERVLGDRAVVSAQLPLDLGPASQPQPDVLLARLPAATYARAHPIPAACPLVVEVSETTLRHDAGEKLQAYARAGVAEYWIVDLVHGRIAMYTEPAGDGYRSQRVAAPGESIRPRAFPDVSIAVDDILA
jgi:Uma2 family endonuclease